MTPLRIAGLLALQVVWLAAAHSATPPSPAFSEEIKKQQTTIYDARGAAVPEGYVVGRSLLSYAHALSPEFKRALGSLGPKDRWLDIGAGEGRAIIDYCTSKYDALLQGAARNEKKARAVAVSIEDRRTHVWHEAAASLEPGQMQYFFGRRLREYSYEELGQFRLITDVMGAFSYTRYMAAFMEKALGFLQVNGEFFTVLQDVRSEKGTNAPHYEGAPFLTDIENPDGSRTSVCAWLKSIGCVEVSCEFKADWTPPIEVYRIRKVCNEVKVPGLRPVHFQAGTPPERRFQLVRPLTR